VKPEYINIAIAVLTGLAGIFGGGFWFTRWVNQVDESIKQLTTIMNKMKSQMKYIQDQKASTDGSLSQIQKSLNESLSEMGRMGGRLDAVWKMFDKYFEKEALERTSDKIKRIMSETE